MTAASHDAVQPGLQPGDLHPAQRARDAFTWRSLLIGTLCVVAVCSLTPYNDFVLSDTSLAAGYLPLAVVLIEFLLVVVVNASLHRWFPRAALTTGELAIIVLMALLACSVTNWGLVKFFVPTPIAPFHVGVADNPYWQAFLGLDLPKWLFPVKNVAEGKTDDAAIWFFTGLPPGEPIPWRAWIVPLCAWGVFAAAMIATLMAMARLVLDQWFSNERLPFPLVQVQAALIEAPEPGRSLNSLFRSQALWIGIGGVLFVHGLSLLNTYYPKYFPRIPLGYDFTGLLGPSATSGDPLSYLDSKMKKATLSFIVIGVTYFIRSKVAFSLWGFYLLTNLVQVERGRVGVEIGDGAWKDQHLGACVAFILGMFWVGREHWMRVLRNSVGLGTSSNYRTSFWIAVLGTAVMIGWLMFMRVHWYIAGPIVLFILAAHLITSRVLAETGIPYFRSGINVSQFYTNAPIGWFSSRDIWFGCVYSVLGPLTTRDGMMGFSLHGQGIVKQAGVDDQRERGKIGLTIAWAMLLGVVVASATTLYCQYSYPTPPSDNVKPQRNYFGAEYIPKRDVANPWNQFNSDVAAGRFRDKPHSPWLHMSIGFVGTCFLEVASLRWAGWPLLPVGYITSYGAFIGNAWFSIFVGWIVKVLIVRFGGSKLFQNARPFFVGIIFGEALAAGIWVIINAIVVMNGGESQVVKFLL